MDTLAVNPTKKTEFITGSHDKTLKVWDLNKPAKSLATMTGHTQGVWCVNYSPQGTQIVTASPEGVAKLWDVKSGKSQADLKVHTKRVSPYIPS